MDLRIGDRDPRHDEVTDTGAIRPRPISPHHLNLIGCGFRLLGGFTASPRASSGGGRLLKAALCSTTSIESRDDFGCSTHH